MYAMPIYWPFLWSSMWVDAIATAWKPTHGSIEVRGGATVTPINAAVARGLEARLRSAQA